jgi:hypothetical protein
MLPIPVASRRMSDWKSRELLGLWTKFSISLRSRSIFSREVSKEMKMSNCSFIALERVMFSIQRLLRTMLGTWTIFILSMRLKTVKSREICSTTKNSFSGPTISTLSPTSNGCLTKRKIQEARNSWVVAAKTNDRESRVVPAVASVVTKLVSWKATAEC